MTYHGELTNDELKREREAFIDKCNFTVYTQKVSDMDEEITLYAIQNSEGKYFRAKGFSGSGKNWVDTLENAKIYPKESSVKRQITYYGKNYPDYPVPKLIILEARVAEVVDQEERLQRILNTQKNNRYNQELRDAYKRYDEAKREYYGLKEDKANNPS